MKEMCFMETIPRYIIHVNRNTLTPDNVSKNMTTILSNLMHVINDCLFLCVYVLLITGGFML